MSTWMLVQIVFNLFFAAGIFIVFMRLSRAPKDDPRLSRGLQILSSKISVLEDLSDRTENQVRQMTLLLEQKMREVQSYCDQADRHVSEVRVATEKSLDVARIFQDKIPHDEIIERRNSIKYLRAARLAHQGMDAQQIAREIDLPMSEIEFIAKVNRERLMYSEDHLPAWAQNEVVAPTSLTTEVNSASLQGMNEFNPQMPSFDWSQAGHEEFNSTTGGMSETPPVGVASSVPAPAASLSDLGEQFRRAMNPAAPAPMESTTPISNAMALTSAGVVAPTPAKVVPAQPASAADISVAEKTALLRARLEARRAASQLPGSDKVTRGTGEAIVRKVQFPRIQRNP